MSRSSHRLVSLQAIRFLHFCIDVRHNRDKAVHNLLLSLLTDTEGDDDQEADLLRFIQSSTQGSVEAAHFDPVRLPTERTR